jgi:uracil-xanthine permease
VQPRSPGWTTGTVLVVSLWTLHGDGRRVAPGEVVAPGERLSWSRTVGLGIQHVVAMFGATFVFPVLMGLSPQLAVLMSGVATLLFLTLTAGHVPSYLGTSASFVGATTTIYSLGGTSADVTGALLVVGAVLAMVGALLHFFGAGLIQRVLPPVVTGAVVMLIGFNLAPVVAQSYWPHDQWVALAVMVFVIVVTVGSHGFASRIAIFLAVVFGYALSWVLDRLVGAVSYTDPATGKLVTEQRVDLGPVADARWFGLPPATTAEVAGWHLPSFHLGFTLVALPIVIALVAENAGHVKAVAEMTGDDLDPMMGRAIGADGLATVVATSVGGSPTTTYAENIGVMAATRVYSTAAYVVAALTAIAFGLSPKFGAVVNAIPAGVLGGITVVLYGMIGLLGAKIWRENHVDFGDPVNLVPVAAGVVIAIGNVTLTFGDDFSLGGIALGTLVVVIGYHLARYLAGRRQAAEEPRS